MENTQGGKINEETARHCSRSCCYFGLIIFLTNQSNSSKLEGNPYGTDNLNQSTIDQLDDENYQNIALRRSKRTDSKRRTNNGLFLQP
jgi:hypothetical protein